MLREVHITNQLDWVNKVACAPGQPHWLPGGFDTYLKILFPVGIDHSIPLAEHSFKTGSIAKMNAHAAFWRKYGIGGPAATDDKLTPIKYRELTQMWDIPYNASFTPTSISEHFGGGPPNLRESKQLNEAFIQLLIQAIGPAIPAYFSGSIENGDYHWVNDLPADWLEKGTVADLAFAYDRDGHFPGYMFDIEHQWCLIHMEFADYVVLGCSSTVAKRITDSPELEALRIP